jgi:hypothetical protein
MIYKVNGSNGAMHTVDTEKVMCTCMAFKFQHKDVFPKLDEKRYCKHLMQFKGEIGILHSTPKSQGVSARPVGPNSHKGKHSRNVIQILQEDIVKWMTVHKDYHSAKFEFCGSWRRGAQTIGDIDLLISDASTVFFRSYVHQTLSDNTDKVLLNGAKNYIRN